MPIELIKDMQKEIETIKALCSQTSQTTAQSFTSHDAEIWDEAAALKDDERVLLPPDDFTVNEVWAYNAAICDYADLLRKKAKEVKGV